DESILGKIFILSRSTGGTLAATGHSLGGGLATAVASTGKIDRAVVFKEVLPNRWTGDRRY
ncbi:MAG: hypothetical protein Q8R89_11305, partial [Desulfomicrobium sp.]|nr:hypothetical protein [Desulfomicrobium sp.]